ncbi:TfoX/Sxy family DNA transformation protein [Pseudoroseicyclus tamaricis]|uniref:Competence protein TfoX n=1 Tax=Pseudoroseicyclus tamaricis TaxID=2705421 RepID=A0A6B2JU74_9RHOB|nr:TfoX/Sxy family DNA transformation protein [Pseudoroseicyclus tamaricis]NDV01610.1 competence protein TfoX [Pseudoroseicyclus tamaricis]
MRAISTIPNLGPASEADYRDAGFSSAEEIEAAGADVAYLRLLAAGKRPHFIGYYALVLGLQGRPWHSCTKDEKAVLRQRYDALMAQARDQGAPSAGLAAFLHDMGFSERSAQ